VVATFARRRTPVPADLVMGVADAHALDGVKNQQ
jgi:hypothetical protein